MILFVGALSLSLRDNEWINRWISNLEMCQTLGGSASTKSACINDDRYIFINDNKRINNPEMCHVLGISAFLKSGAIDEESDMSKIALSIRPVPGKSWFTVGPYEWWKYDCNPSQLKSVLPHLKYKSLCDSSTRNVPYVLSTISTSVSCLPLPPFGATNN